jgi:hypothetical protein
VPQGPEVLNWDARARCPMPNQSEPNFDQLIPPAIVKEAQK